MNDLFIQLIRSTTQATNGDDNKRQIDVLRQHIVRNTKQLARTYSSHICLHIYSQNGWQYNYLIVLYCSKASSLASLQMHTPDDGCCQFKFSQLLLRRPKYLLMSSVVGWKQSRRQVTWYTSRCPGIIQKFSVIDNTLLPGQWRLRVHMPKQSDSIQSVLSPFNVAPLSDYDHPHGFQNLNTNSHSKFNIYEPINGSYISSLEIITCNSHWR